MTDPPPQPRDPHPADRHPTPERRPIYYPAGRGLLFWAFILFLLWLIAGAPGGADWLP